jgi:putative DNA primase/helicase
MEYSLMAEATLSAAPIRHNSLEIVNPGMDPRVKLMSAVIGRSLLCVEECDQFIEHGGASLVPDVPFFNIATEMEKQRRSGNSPICRTVNEALKGDTAYIKFGGHNFLSGLTEIASEKREPMVELIGALTVEKEAPENSDDDIALRFADRHENSLRFVAPWGRWLRWNGVKWAFDETLYAFDSARKICREAATLAESYNSAKSLTSAKTVAAVVQLARADRRIAAQVDQWDRDTWAINTPGGIVDLRTGATRTHSPHDFITKITPVAPDASQQTPLWNQFLGRITRGDEPLVKFLQRVTGYLLTGVTREHALFFLYGTGANGKSVFVNTISHALGDYHRTAPIETFTASNREAHPTDLASLRGARLVTAVETEEGRRWAESRIKALTGGDKIAARFMRQDFFEFTPNFKLLIAGNHKPGLRSVDEAIRRRFHLIPFTVTIPEAERDQHLPERLKGELPGILSWAVEGCLDWQRQGLAPPEAVKSATNQYLESEDAVAAWIDDAVTLNANAWARSSALFASWQIWAEKAGEYIGSQKRFSQNLEVRGFVPERRRDGRGFTGLELHETEQCG